MEHWSWPAYQGLGAGEVGVRAEASRALLGPGWCGVCPRLCRVNRLADQRGLCAVGRHAVVASHFPHFGEEDCLRGRNGSGTIFFAGCNLRCVFCQNFGISWQAHGEPVSPGQLAAMMLELQDRGCHNINLVTPSPAPAATATSQAGPGSRTRRRNPHPPATGPADRGSAPPRGRRRGQPSHRHAGVAGPQLVRPGGLEPAEHLLRPRVRGRPVQLQPRPPLLTSASMRPARIR